MAKSATRASAPPRPVARSRPKRNQQPISLKKRVKTFFALLLLVFETITAAVLIGTLSLFYRFSHSLPDVSDLTNYIRPQVATVVYSQDMVELGRLETLNRKPITLNDMCQNLKDATVSIEDHRFYEHFGVDVRGIMRAVVADYITGENATKQGASTLTQQLVRNIGNFGLSREKRFSRKIREALIAVRVEQVYSKKQILNLYLNNVYYGGGAYGVQAAAITYFNLPASRLDLSQSALLAGLPQRPRTYSPYEHRKRALQRRDEVLDSMLKYNYITPDQCEAAKAETLHFVPQRKHRDYNFKAPYFVGYVLNDLIQRYGPDHVYSGLRIVTTLNWKMQRLAENKLEEGLQAKTDAGCNQGCLVALDNSNGYIRAMVGGRNYHASQFNFVGVPYYNETDKRWDTKQGKRPPGSTFKLFDYAAAFDTGSLSIDDTFQDRPIPYPRHPDKVVRDFEPYSYRTMTCRDAIAHSINTIAVQVAEKVGIQTVIEYAHKMGINSKLDPYYPTAIGAYAVHPLDIATAYSVVATGGNKYQPMGIVRVIDSDGNIEEENLPTVTERVIKPSTVNQLAEGLAAVVDYGTGQAAKAVKGAHGKTGTTTDSRDAWFAGYTPDLTTVVWVAAVHHDRKGRETYAPMPGQTGGAICAPIWREFMLLALPEQHKFLLAQQNAPTEIRPAKKNPPAANLQQKPKPPSDKTAADSQPAVPDLPRSRQDSVIQPVSNQTPLENSARADMSPPHPGDTPQDTPDRQAADPSPPRQPAPAVQSPPKTVAAMPNQNSHPAVFHQALPAPTMVDVTVCDETGLRATMWCPSQVSRRMSVQRARHLKYCKQHHAPQ